MDCKDNVDFPFSSLFYNFISLGCSNSWTGKDYNWTVYLTKVNRRRIMIWTESRKKMLGCILRKCLQITGPNKAVEKDKKNRQKSPSLMILGA